MKTKKLVSLIAIILCTVAVSFAQKHHKGKGTIEDRINHRLDKMDEIVKFTGNQRSDLKTLLTDLARKKKDAFCANEIGTDGMKNAMKSINKEKKEGVKKILTDGQLKLLKDFMKAKREERKNKSNNKTFDDDKEK